MPTDSGLVQSLRAIKATGKAELHRRLFAIVGLRLEEQKELDRVAEHERSKLKPAPTA